MRIFNQIFLLMSLTSFLLTSCDKNEGDNETLGCTDPLSYTFDSLAVSDDGSCAYNFGGRGMGQIDVSAVVNTNNEYDIFVDSNYIGRLSGFFPNGALCGDPDTPAVLIEFGNHSIRAESVDGSIIREGDVYLSAQQCIVVLIEELTLVGAGGGGTAGDVIFWINQDFGCGQINVNVSGVGSSTISGFFNSTPNCSNTGSGGNFNNLAPGNYSFTASCTGLSWNGSFTISENNCTTYQLEVVSNNGTMTDPRDNKTYETITIGNQTWMAENLRFSQNVPGVWQNPYVNTAVYGYHYDWETIMNGANSSAATPSGVRGICPPGWHIPSPNEFRILRDNVGASTFTAGRALKSTSGWVSVSPICPGSISGGVTGVGNGTNESGFNAYPAGSIGGICDFGTGVYTVFWTSEDGEAPTPSAYSANLTYQFDRFTGAGGLVYKIDKQSCRCLKD